MAIVNLYIASHIPYVYWTLKCCSWGMMTRTYLSIIMQSHFPHFFFFWFVFLTHCRTTSCLHSSTTRYRRRQWCRQIPKLVRFNGRKVACPSTWRDLLALSFRWNGDERKWMKEMVHKQSVWKKRRMEGLTGASAHCHSFIDK